MIPRSQNAFHHCGSKKPERPAGHSSPRVGRRDVRLDDCEEAVSLQPEPRPYVVISADTHAGADLLDYRPYLDREFHDEFDTWASDFSEGWESFDTAQMFDTAQVEAYDENLRVGVASFKSPYNWDSAKRLEHLQRDGIVAEVVLPNTVPPFFPSGVVTAPAPTTKEEYRLRWAGVKAHNRWLAEFCADTPGRRAGIAQIFLTDVDDAVAEVRWAKEHGLSGIIIPGDHHRKLNNLFELSLDRFWAACAELDLPVLRHSQAVSDPETPESGPAGPAIGIFEGFPFLARTLPQLMIGGVFHRHPKLKFVFTEALGAWVLPALKTLDVWFAEAKTKGSVAYPFGYPAIKDYEFTPSEYFARNCYIGSFLTENDIDARYKIGTDRIMWGADYPHHESTWPYSTIALRMNFAAVPENEVRMMVGATAAKIYGFDLDYLQTIADKVGPSVEELTKPVPASEVPTTSVCPTFLASPGLLH
jgi:predicted TIM-barrel fold metal-dependent hydrolase